MLANGIGRWMVIGKVPYFDSLESNITTQEMDIIF